MVNNFINFNNINNRMQSVMNRTFIFIPFRAFGNALKNLLDLTKNSKIYFDF